MAKTKKAKQNKGPQKDASKSIKDVDLAGDAATVLGTAIGVVGATANFIGSKVAEAVSPSKPKRAASKKAGAKQTASAKKGGAKKTIGAKKKSAAKKAKRR